MHERGSPVSVKIASRVLAAKQKWGSEMEFLDSTGGWAAGTRDILIRAGSPFEQPLSTSHVVQLSLSRLHTTMLDKIVAQLGEC